MDKDKKLIDGISLLLREAGYTDIKVRKENGGTLVDASLGRGGAVFYFAPQTQKAPKRIEQGGPETLVVPLDVSTVPNMPGTLAQIRANPDLIQVLDIPAQHIRYLS